MLGVAGYAANELEVREDGNDLIVRGAARALQSNGETIRRLIEPSFERRFRLLDGFRLDEWQLRNGLLMVDVARDPNEVVQTVYLQPAAPLDRLEFVLVITDYQGGLGGAIDSPLPCQPTASGVLPNEDVPCATTAP